MPWSLIHHPHPQHHVSFATPSTLFLHECTDGLPFDGDGVLAEFAAAERLLPVALGTLDDVLAEILQLQLLQLGLLLLGQLLSATGRRRVRGGAM